MDPVSMVCCKYKKFMWLQGRLDNLIEEKSIEVHWMNRNQLCFRKSFSSKWWKLWRASNLPSSLPQGICLQLLAHFFMDIPFLSTSTFLSFYPQAGFHSLSMRNNRTIGQFAFTSCVLVYACRIHEDVTLQVRIMTFLRKLCLTKLHQ